MGDLRGNYVKYKETDCQNQEDSGKSASEQVAMLVLILIYVILMSL